MLGGQVVLQPQDPTAGVSQKGSSEAAVSCEMGSGGLAAGPPDNKPAMRKSAFTNIGASVA
ncbi:MAG: hypothetical protein LBB40_01185 [Holophagales bacterium]|nr:hypothetical protein [Holophagales bacterium]